jgi:hypothetical protein
VKHFSWTGFTRQTEGGFSAGLSGFFCFGVTILSNLFFRAKHFSEDWLILPAQPVKLNVKPD